MLHAVQEHAPVGQAGERVEISQLVRARLGLLALGDVARERDEPGFIARSGAFLAGNGQLKPVRSALEFQAVLVARRIARAVRGLQRCMAACGGLGRDHVAQQATQKHLGRHGQCFGPRRPVVVDAAIQPHLEQQVGDGVERTLQVIARGAQLRRHVARQCHGPLAPRGQEPGEPGEQQAQHRAHQGHRVVPLILKTRRKRRQGRHLQHPAAATQFQHTPCLQTRRDISLHSGLVHNVAK